MLRRALLKRSLQISAGFVLLLIGLYILPNFININRNRLYIEEQLESLMNFDIEVKDIVSFRVLPYPALIIKDVDVKTQIAKDSEIPAITFLNAKQIFISFNLFDLIQGELNINKIVIDRGNFNYAFYKKTNFENLPEFLSGKNFNNIFIKDSILTFSSEDLSTERRIENININFNTADNGIKGYGSFKYLSNKIDDISMHLSFLNSENYDLNIDFEYVNGANNIDSKFHLIVKNDIPIVNGAMNLTSNNLYEFFPKIDTALFAPNVPLFKNKINISTDIKITRDEVILSNGHLNSDDAFAKWYATIPYKKESFGEYIVDIDNMNYNIDFSNLKLSKIFNIKEEDDDEADYYDDDADDDSGNNSFDILFESQDLLRILKFGKFNITSKNIILSDSVATDFVLTTSQASSDRKIGKKQSVETEDGVINIDKFSYNIGKNNIIIDGKLYNIQDNLTMNLNVKSNIPFFLKTKLLGTTVLNSFEGNLIQSKNNLQIIDMLIDVGGNKILGSFSKEYLENNNPNYQISIKSDIINTGNFIDEKDIDLSFIIYKLSLLKNVNFSLNAMIKKVITPSKTYDLFRLNTDFVNNNLLINRLNFINDGYTSDINGDLLNIVGESGVFKNFNYVITSDNLKGISLAFLQNKFIDKIISNGVKSVKIKLNGDAYNPVSDVSAVIGDINIKITGKLLEEEASYNLDLSHSELKGFLFAWGLIDESLVNYFYDDIPFSITANVKGNNIEDINLKINDNLFTGEILQKNISKRKNTEEYETTINLSIDNLNLRNIIKRLKDTDGYIDLLLKVIRSAPYNINLKANSITEYDGNLYKNMDLSLLNSTNPGKLVFNIQKGLTDLLITSEILNNRIFEGELSVKNYNLPTDLMNNELLNLVSGLIDAKLTFSTDGLNAYQLISNLSSDFQVNMTNGIIEGISNYDEIFFNIGELANISTNNILYILENSFKGGSLNFDNLKIEGKIENANINKSVFVLNSKNIIVNGFISGNLITKSISIESIFEITGISVDVLNLIYNLTGFVNNLTGDVNTSALISKINTSYIQKKIRDSK